jgi:Tfp pilus assembly protein PilX
MKRFGRGTPLRAQRGVTLLVSMIFLVVLTLIVVSAIKVSNVNTRLAGNMQLQNEADAAAQQGLESMISTDFTTLPAASTTSVDINGSGLTGSTYSVYVPAPKCIVIKPIKTSQLDASNSLDQPCYASGAAQNTGIVGGNANGASLCSNSNWEVNSTAVVPSTGASAPTVHQGIAVRVAVGDAC